MANNRDEWTDDGVKHVVHHYPKSGGIAALLEVVPGFFQIFGIGHIYAGNVLTGLFFMFGYWLVAVINGLLMFVAIGFITGPLCWLLTMVVSSVLAARACRAR